MKLGSLAAIVLLFGATCGHCGEVISWTKPTSGFWQDTNSWSIPRLPGPDLDGTAITNAGWKAVEINAATTLNYADSVQIQQLHVAAPQDSFNVLLLNYAGTDRPLRVARDMVLGTNTSIASLFSGVSAGSMYLSAPAAFTSSTLSVATNLVIGPAGQGELNLTNCLTSGTKLVLALKNESTAYHASGVTDFTNIIVFENGAFNLAAGWVSAQTLDVQSLGYFELEYGWQKRAGVGRVRQTGGSMQSQVMRLGMSEMSQVGAVGEYWLEGGTLICPQLRPINGAIHHISGTNLSTSILLPAEAGAHADYNLSGGILVSSNVAIGTASLYAPGRGLFLQSGGIHTNQLLQSRGEVRKQQLSRYGEYRLTGGYLFSDRIEAYSGFFSQSGGTNKTADVNIDCGGAYDLEGGLLVTSNTTVATCYTQLSWFTNRAGVHRVETLLSLGQCVRYLLAGGELTAPFISLAEGAELRIESGTTLNSGAIVMQGGTIFSQGTRQLGSLQVLTGATTWCGYIDITNSVLMFGEPEVPTTLRFRESSDVSWTGNVVIREYNPTNSAGSDRLFIGTDQNGLSSDQLARIMFLNPYGWPMGAYPAMITDQGEILPVEPTRIALSSGGNDVIMSWQGPYQLATATNAAGPFEVIPGATSPYTNNTSDSPQRYFRLQ